MQRAPSSADPYPTGWFVVAYSSELPADRPLAVHYFGMDLVLFRGPATEVTLAEATCPHLGTNLAVAGELIDGCLRCPMHGWRYDGTGACVAAPGSQKVPSAHLRTWRVVERDGLVWTWRGADQPTWPVPGVPEHDDAGWTTFQDAGNRWMVRTIPEVIQENACDVRHLLELHGFPDPQSQGVDVDGATLTSRFTHSRAYPEAGLDKPIEVRTEIVIYGVGLSKQTSASAAGVTSTSLCTTTPVDEGTVDLRMASAVQRLGDEDLTGAVHQVVLDTTRGTIEEDIPIWESRNYRVARFDSGDRGISTFQRWVRQFRTEEAAVVAIGADRW